MVGMIVINTQIKSYIHLPEEVKAPIIKHSRVGKCMSTIRTERERERGKDEEKRDECVSE